jgi:hypothetical protein
MSKREAHYAQAISLLIGMKPAAVLLPPLLLLLLPLLPQVGREFSARRQPTKSLT